MKHVHLDHPYTLKSDENRVNAPPPSDGQFSAVSTPIAMTRVSLKSLDETYNIGTTL